MKKNSIYIGLAVVAGLLAGYLIFSGNADNTAGDHIEKTASGQMWTCSMHPQIMRPEPGDCPICGMDLIPAEAGAEGLSTKQFKMTENAMALANVQTTVVGTDQTDTGGVRLSGKIRENEEANAVQVSYFAGRIEKLYINFTGERVNKGQLLATIYSPELISAQQELLTAAALKTSQPELYKAVRNKLKLWKLSGEQIDRIEASGKVKENFPVYATVSGTVTDKMVAEGDYIKQGQPLYKIADLNTVWAVFDAYENQIAALKKGQQLTITTNAYPGKAFDAKISFIDPVLNSATRTVMVRAVLKNNNNIFKPGMFVEATIEGEEIKTDGAISIPASAILWTGERSVVYVKTDPNRPVFEMREVMLGHYSGESYLVLSGLDGGEEIVTNGAFTVDAAAQLQGKKSMMNKTGGKTTGGHEGHTGMRQKSPENTDTVNYHSRMNTRIEVNEKFQGQLKKAVDEYMVLKDALVQSKPEKAQESAKALVEKIKGVNMKLLPDNEAHDHWMTIEKEIRKASNAIAASPDIAVQRDHFKQLSAHLISGVNLFGINQKVYSQFCPMADNNKGAYWLSLEEKIMNPYLGDTMLNCGEVKMTIQ